MKATFTLVPIQVNAFELLRCPRLVDIWSTKDVLADPSTNVRRAVYAGEAWAMDAAFGVYSNKCLQVQVQHKLAWRVDMMSPKPW